MMFSTSSPTYPASVSVVASAIVKGTSRMRASVWASSVLPEPVGPISRIFDFVSSTSLWGGLMFEALAVIVDGDREHLLGVRLADDIVVEDFADLFRGRNPIGRCCQR